MKPGRIAILERVAWLIGAAGMTAAVAAFDPRVGLFFGSALLFASTIEWRRP